MYPFRSDKGSVQVHSDISENFSREHAGKDERNACGSGAQFSAGVDNTTCFFSLASFAESIQDLGNEAFQGSMMVNRCAGIVLVLSGMLLTAWGDSPPHGSSSDEGVPPVSSGVDLRGRPARVIEGLFRRV